jgi:hypothetical protein
MRRAPALQHDGAIVPDDSASAAPSGDDDVYGARATATTTPVRFAGGPWAGRRARYVHVVDLTPMPCPGGRYRFRELEPDGTVVYAFAAG